jgi:hypothetical protein
MAFAGEPTPPTTLDLVPQYQDLHVFGDVAACEQRQPAEQPDHEQIDQAEEHECRG